MNVIINAPYPVSTNRIWRNAGGRMVQNPEAKRWKREVSWLAKSAGAKMTTADVAVSLKLHPRAKKDGSASAIRIDLDNALKSALDALQGVVYVDDAQVKRVLAEVGPPKTDGGLTIEVSDMVSNVKMELNNGK